MNSSKLLRILFDCSWCAVGRVLPAHIFLGLLWAALASPLFALGPNLYVHSECLFCPSSWDTTTVTVNLELGGGPYVDGHYVVRQCDNNGFNCHNHDFTITNNAITSGATYSLLFTVAGDNRGQVTQNFFLTVDHDFTVDPPRPCSGLAGWIDKGQSPGYNTEGDVASDHPQSVTVVVDPQTNLKCPDEKAGGTKPSCAGCGGGKAPAGKPMAEYTINSMLVSLSISDTPLRYSQHMDRRSISRLYTTNEKSSQRLRLIPPISGRNGRSTGWRT